MFFRKKKPESLQNSSARTRIGLLKTRTSVLGKLSALFKKETQTENLWDELERILIEADMGVKLTCEVLENLKKHIQKITDKDEVLKNLEKEILKNFLPRSRTLSVGAASPSVILILGVNGVGKTLSTAKLAYKLKNEGKKIILAAGDTFRAAAIEQLGILGDKIDIDVIKHSHGADPAAVCYDAMTAAKARGKDFLIVDTAGRSHVDKNLMESLKKIKRVIDNRFPGTLGEVLLVLDATTGQNALSQAKTFINEIGITGIIMAKLDGTSKGGIIGAIEKQLSVPVKFIGVGETLEDFEVFDPEVFVSSLFEF